MKNLVNNIINYIIRIISFLREQMGKSNVMYKIESLIYKPDVLTHIAVNTIKDVSFTLKNVYRHEKNYY